MIKIFKCGKCGKAFDSEKECLEHEQNCNKGLEEKIIRELGQYGIDVQHVAIKDISKFNLILRYQAQITSNIPSGYNLNFTFNFDDEDEITAEFINHQLRKYMGKEFEGKFNDGADLYDGYTTYGLDNIDLTLIAQVFEGCRVRIQILDDGLSDIDASIKKFVDNSPTYPKDTNNNIGQSIHEIFD